MRTSGHTLVELAVVLAVLSLLLGIASPRVAAWGDHLAVQAEREAVVALLHRARVEARLAGGSVVEVAVGASGDEVRLLVVGDSLVAAHRTGHAGVALEVAGSRESARLRFGPMGTGRASTLTLELRRGQATAEVVVSSYGRVRR